MSLSLLLPLLVSVSPASLAAAPEAFPAEEAESADPSLHEKEGAKKGGKGKGGKKGAKAKREKEAKIAAGEFRNSARNLKKGTFLLHPLLMPSSYSVSDKVMVLAPILGQISGPQAAVRYSFLNQKKQDVAIEPWLASNWQFSSLTAGANLRYTMEVGKGNRLNLGAGAGFSTTLSEVEDVAGDGTDIDTDDLGDVDTSGLTSTSIEVGYDLVQDDRTTWRFTGQTDPYQAAQGAASATVAANWNHSFGKDFRLSLGLAAYVGTFPLADELAQLGIDLPDLLVLPLPTVELWWKF